MPIHGIIRFPLKSNVVYKDNQGVIRMERNVQDSCTVNYHHIHIRYCFVKYRQDKGAFSIDYCPTWKMLDNYFTKPLQRRLSNVLRLIIMGWKHGSELELFSPPPSKERVFKIDEAENDNSSFNKKYYVDTRIQKGGIEERASERVISKKVLQKGNILTQISTHKNKLTTNQLCKDVTQRHVESVYSNK